LLVGHLLDRSEKAGRGDKDVALMVARFTGISLGLLAFAITVTAGLLVRNPVEVILSRSIFALFVFCLIGLLLGGAAQMVIAEYDKDRESEILKRYREDMTAENDAGTPRRQDAGPSDRSTEGGGESIAT
jgi:hypothetical protein